MIILILWNLEGGGVHEILSRGKVILQIETELDWFPKLW